MPKLKHVEDVIFGEAETHTVCGVKITPKTEVIRMKDSTAESIQVVDDAGGICRYCKRTVDAYQGGEKNGKLKLLNAMTGVLRMFAAFEGVEEGMGAGEKEGPKKGTAETFSFPGPTSGKGH